MTKPKTPRKDAATQFAPFILKSVGEDGGFTTTLDVDELTDEQVLRTLDLLYNEPGKRTPTSLPMERDTYYRGCSDTELATLDALERVRAEPDEE